MINPLKKITDIFSSELTEVKSKATSMIQSEVNSIIRELEDLPEDRIPCIKITHRTNQLKDQVMELLASVNIGVEDLPEYQEILDLEDARKKLTLERYIKLIPNSESVTPFATFHEVDKNGLASCPQSEGLLIKLFEAAVKVLFEHVHFENTLLEKLGVEIEALVQKCPVENDLERANVIEFLSHYDRFKHYNEGLSKNATLEAKIQELRAVLFFQQQAQLLNNDEGPVSEGLAEFINYWMGYLNELTEEQQCSKMALISAADQCSKAYNEYLNRSS